MKWSQFAVLIAVIVSSVITIAYAQSYGGVGFAPIAPAVTNCPSGVTNGAMLCAVGTSAANYALYVSYNAGTYQPLVPAVSGGVTTFNGRTGNVNLTKSDVTSVGLSVATTVTSTATSTVQ